MQTPQNRQRAACLLAAATMSIVICEAIIGHAHALDPQQFAARAGRVPAPAALTASLTVALPGATSERLAAAGTVLATR